MGAELESRQLDIDRIVDAVRHFERTFIEESRTNREAEKMANIFSAGAFSLAFAVVAMGSVEDLFAVQNIPLYWKAALGLLVIVFAFVVIRILMRMASGEWVQTDREGR